MTANTAHTDLEDLVTRLAAIDDADARVRLLGESVHSGQARAVAERLKEEADRARYQDVSMALRWCGDVVALGRMAGAPAVVALGRMAEALLLYDGGRYRDSLALFDEASSLFRGNGDEVGWARAQIGRTATCMALARFDEALERAEQARAILERAGDTLRVASIDNNLVALLERMNRPAEALVYSERAVDAYRGTGLSHRTVGTLCNHALLLWRLGYVRDALDTFQEARQGCVALGAGVDAARLDVNIGTVYLALGRYAEAVSMLTTSRRALLDANAPQPSASAGLYLAESYIRLGRFQEAAGIASGVCDELARLGDPVQQVQAMVLLALADAGLHERGRALHTLDVAATMLAGDEGLAAHRAVLDLYRAQLLLQDGLIDEAQAQLEHAIPLLREAGLALEMAMAQVTRGHALIAGDRAGDALDVSGDALAAVEDAGLDWLAAQALHLRGRAQMHLGHGAAAARSLADAMRRLNRVNRHVAWDDHATFGNAASSLYTDAVSLALQQEQVGVALYYVEYAKARALADHLRGHVDIRPRARDERSRALVAELDELRARYAWLGATGRTEYAPGTSTAAVRWAAPPPQNPDMRLESARIERRMAEIWRELQASNPAYRGEIAALDLAAGARRGDDDDEAAAERWLAAVCTALDAGDRVALLQYTALGDDLVLFVVRAGAVHAQRLEGAAAELQRLVSLLRLNVERTAAAVVTGGRALAALGANARGLLQRLYTILLAPAAPLLDGAERLVVVPHGMGHHVPFHALHDGRTYLVEQVAVSYAPSAGLIEHFDARHRLLQARGRSCNEALVLSCSNGGALPHVEAEGGAVVAALGGKLLREEEATLRTLQALAAGYDVLHLAAHACFRPDEPLFSSLQLHDGRLSTLEVFDLELNCALVTLSACETALGVTGAGDELMGLSRAFLYAGAPSLVLSLWKVEDRSTAALMDVFYRALRDGAGKAEALRRAQLALLHDTDHGSPYFWAPFGLIGHAGPLHGRINPP